MPRPWQRGQTFGVVPGLAPVPRHVEHMVDIGTASDTCAPSIAWSNEIEVGTRASAAPGTRTAPAAPEEVRQDVAEAADVEVAEAAGRAAGAAEDAATAVVLLALLRVAQDVVRLGDLLEPLLRRLVARVVVRVVLLGQAVIRLLDLGDARLSVDAEHFIGVAHGMKSSIW
jgi:hypothetical protein